MTNRYFTSRKCLQEPIPEIYEAQGLLSKAADHHLSGEYEKAANAIKAADMNELFDWAESLWGKSPPNTRCIQHEALHAAIPEPHLVNPKKPAKNNKLLQSLIDRDGYHCRWCGIPVIQSKVPNYLKHFYPNVLRWGKDLNNHQKHAAFQAMELQGDHVKPKSKGGSNSLENMVVSCAPCNCGRGEAFPEDMNLIRLNPENDPEIKSEWDGLIRVLAK